MIYIIGAGGVGSWLTPAMCMLVGAKNVTLIDGDRLEKKNLNRQLFTEAEIGRNKAEALAGRCKCACVPRYFSTGMIEIEAGSWFMVGVDNNPARLHVLREADLCGSRCIFGANETNSSEAYYYHPDWRGSERDPRVYIPEILTDATGDPHAARIGCTGEVQAQNPQLVNANFMAAGLMLHLFSFYRFNSHTLEASVLDQLPYRYLANMTRLENIRWQPSNETAVVES